jgi:ABC-type transport system substrate-binding protein
MPLAPAFRLLLPCFAGLAAALLLAGCSNDPNPPPLHTKRPDGSPWVVRYAYMPDEVRSLDPQVMYDQVSRIIVEPVMDTLLAYNPMKTDPYEVMPQMLAAMPTHTVEADGGVTYHCELQKGIPFHDDPCFPGGKGREVIAADVQYSFQRLCDPAVESPFFGGLSTYIKGMDAAQKAATAAGKFDYDTNHVSGLVVKDRTHFDLQLIKPYPQIVYWLALHATTPVAREAVEYYDGLPHPDGKGGTVQRPLFRFHMVGTGPFRVVDHIQGTRWRLERVPGYKTERFPEGGWPPEREAANRPWAGHSLPLVDEVQLPVFRELLPIWLVGRQGYLDRIGMMKDAASAAITTSSELTPKYRDRGFQLIRVVEPSTFYMVFNMQDPVVGKNRKLRQALSCAFDRQGYSNMAYGGVAPVAQQLLCPGVYGYDAHFKNPYDFDLQKARRLLAEAGYPGGIDPKTNEPLEINMDVVANGGDERQLAEYEQRQFEQVGVRMKVIENTFARQQEKEDQGNFQFITGSGWGADYPDAENFFFLFTKDSFPPEGKNSARYVNPDFEDLYAKMATMENTPERLSLIKRLNDILLEDCPIILEFHKGYYVLVPPWAPPNHLNLLLEGGLRYVWSDPVLRAKLRREWNPMAKWPFVVVPGFMALAVAWAVQINRRRVA